MDIFSLTSAQWWDLGISLGIIVLTVVLARPVLSFVLDKIVKRVTGATKTNLDDIIIEAVRGPRLKPKLPRPLSEVTSWSVVSGGVMVVGRPKVS